MRLAEKPLTAAVLNQKRLEENKVQFLQTLEDLKILTENNQQVEAKTNKTWENIQNKHAFIIYV